MELLWLLITVLARVYRICIFTSCVPHMHIHLVPRHKGDGLKGFFWPRQRYKDEAVILGIQDTIRATVAKLQARE